MGPSTIREATPTDYREAAGLLAECAAAGSRVRPRGGATKLGWGTPTPEPDLELSTAGLTAIVEHNAGDLTAVLQAGVPLAEAQAAFAEHGQMLALDPPAATAGERATIGGVVATGDSGPLRHRYGSPRDLVLGMTAALTSGEVVQSGGKVIKNVAGYDLAKLFTGSFGTLGVIVELAVRLHPLAPATATAVGTSPDPTRVADAAGALAHSALELQSLDVGWKGSRGRVLARCAGARADSAAGAACRLLGEHGLETDIVDDDEPLWAEQRTLQRSADGAVLRVSAVQGQLAAVLQEAERAGGAAVGRAALGVCWLTVPHPDAERVAAVRRNLAPAPCVLLDGPESLRAAIDPWDHADGGTLAVMRRLKERFDEPAVLNRGLFVGGI